MKAPIAITTLCVVLTAPTERASTAETAWAWGGNAYGQASVPPSIGPIAAVATGSVGQHSVCLTPWGEVRAWGAGQFSADTDSGVHHGQSVVPLGLGPVRAVSAGGYHTLALLESGGVVAWGAGSQSSVSGVHRRQSIVPSGLGTVVAVAAGEFHSVALRSDGGVRAWGDDSRLQLTIPSHVTNIVAISAGAAHTLALRADGKVRGWGDFTSGQNAIPRDLPPAVAIAAGGAHSLALLADQTVRAWGSNSSGQRVVPAGLTGVAAIAAGSTHSMALLSNGVVRAWGNPQASSVPGALGPVSSASAGLAHALAAEHDPYTVLQSRELAPFSFDMPRQWTVSDIASEPGFDARLTVVARGQLGSTTRFLTVRVDGSVVASGLFGAGSGAGLCMAETSVADLTIPATVFAKMAADGVLVVRIEPSLNATSTGCPDATLSVRIRFRAPIVDCDGNGLQDSCQLIMDGGRPDCNGNGVLDSCEIASGVGMDSNTNGVLDECEADCDGNGVLDAEEVGSGTVADCDRNGRPDSCDIALGDADVDGDGVLDSCADDCNGNGLPDPWECLSGLTADCDGNRIPDSCEVAVPLASLTDSATGQRFLAFASTTRRHARSQAAAVRGSLAKIASPAQNNLISSTFGAIDGIGRLLWIGLEAPGGTVDFRWPDGTSPSFTRWKPGEPNNTYGQETFVEMNGRFWNDVGDGGVPGAPYASVVLVGPDGVPDCNANGLVDACEIASGAIEDCNSNGIPDVCEIGRDPSLDCNGDGLIDACQGGPDGPDCDGDGTFDVCQIAGGAEDKNGNGKLDSCEYGWGDLNLDGVVDGIDLGGLLAIWGLQNPPYADLNDDGWVDGNDLGIMLAHWGPVP